jgi:hypothetical protein
VRWCLCDGRAFEGRMRGKRHRTSSNKARAKAREIKPQRFPEIEQPHPGQERSFQGGPAPRRHPSLSGSAGHTIASTSRRDIRCSSDTSFPAVELRVEALAAPAMASLVRPAACRGGRSSFLMLLRLRGLGLPWRPCTALHRVFLTLDIFTTTPVRAQVFLTPPPPSALCPERP